VSLPRSAGAQPFSYLHPTLGGPNEVTSADSTPIRAFGFGLGYTTFERVGLRADAEVATDGTVRASLRVLNTGDRAGTDLVQLYGRDLVASVTRPVAQLLGYARVSLEPGESAIVSFEVPTCRLSFTNSRFDRVVEPGEIELWVGGSCAERQTQTTVLLTGEDSPVGDTTVLTTASVHRDRGAA
jgi:beta-glucosidase